MSKRNPKQSLICEGSPVVGYTYLMYSLQLITMIEIRQLCFSYNSHKLQSPVHEDSPAEQFIKRTLNGIAFVQAFAQSADQFADEFGDMYKSVVVATVIRFHVSNA